MSLGYSLFFTKKGRENNFTKLKKENIVSFSRLSFVWEFFVQSEADWFIINYSSIKKVEGDPFDADVPVGCIPIIDDSLHRLLSKSALWSIRSVARTCGTCAHTCIISLSRVTLSFRITRYCAEGGFIIED